MSVSNSSVLKKTGTNHHLVLLLEEELRSGWVRDHHLVLLPEVERRSAEVVGSGYTV